jgi:hypothetical protein
MGTGVRWALPMGLVGVIARIFCATSIATLLSGLSRGASL